MTSDNDRFLQITDEIVQYQLVRSVVLSIIHNFFRKQNFVLVDPPILHEQIANKKGEIYLPIYDNRYSLNSSNALYMSVYASHFEKVYAISPTFRDEQNSVNHLVEFRMLEAEIIGMSFDELVNFVENFVVYILEELLISNEIAHMHVLKRRIESLVENFRPDRITYDDFLIKLNNSTGLQIVRNIDLSDNDYIISQSLQSPVFIVDYPSQIASWTAKRKDNRTAFAFNLILPKTYGELCEGCERTDDVELLKYKMNCAGIDNLQWFVNAVKSIGKPRCGFGVGIDRLIRWILGAQNLSDTVLFPRTRTI